MSETTFNSGNSYGPEPVVVQIAVAPQVGALGTIVTPNAKRINKISVKNLDGVSVTLKVQETDTNPNGSAGAPSWSDVSGTEITVVVGGTADVDLSGKILKKYARLYGGATVAGAGSSVCRITIEDLDLINNFRQVVPYGVG